jgi:DNA-directed RNA polymerase specialized sigma24 family protein
MSIGRCAAYEAELSWEPEGGRSLKSWVALNVQFDVQRALVKSGQEMASDIEPPDEEDLETVILVHEALDYLRAKLRDEEWTALWLYHAEGWTCAEMGKKMGISTHGVHCLLSRTRKKAERIWRLAA